MSNNTEKALPEYLDIKEAAAYLGLPSIWTLRKAIANREITYQKWGARLVRFKRSDLDNFKKKFQVPALV